MGIRTLLSPVINPFVRIDKRPDSHRHILLLSAQNGVGPRLTALTFWRGSLLWLAWEDYQHDVPHIFTDSRYALAK